jgi:prepilin-type N-terminal cleavage/methylation domain-containing protein
MGCSDREVVMRERGFTLLEALVALAILALVMIGFLSLFTTSERISRAQSATADVQETLRYVLAEMIRNGRMGGAGGVPAVAQQTITPPTYVPGGVVVQDNVASGMSIGGIDVVPSTDILELRGAFTSPIYDIGSGIGGAYSYDSTSNTGQVTVPANSVTGDAQDTSALVNHFADPRAAPVPAFIVTVQRANLALDDGHQRLLTNYGAALLTGSEGGGTFDFTTTAVSGEAAAFLALNPGGVYPSGLANVVNLSIVDVLRYFVGLDPNTGVPTLYVNDRVADTIQPVASDIVDLQVALGCDRDLTGVIPYVGATAGDDYWLFDNRSGSPETYADLAKPSDAVPMIAYLRQVRITLVARVPTPDSSWVQPPIANEDGRNILADAPYLGAAAKNYRYRSLTDLIKLRSLGPIL